MTNEQAPTYEELKGRLASTEAALHALRDGQVDTIAGRHGTLVVRLAEVEARADHIKQVLLAIRNVNQLIVSEDDPLRLIERTCVNLTETMGYLNAWIALLDDEGRAATATACSGFDGGFTAMGELLAAGEYPARMKQALEHDGVIVVSNPKAECRECPLSAEYGGRAGLSRGLRYGGKTYGILSVSVPVAYADDEEEQALFDGIAGDLAFALHRIEAAKHLRESREMLARTERIAHVGSWEWDIADDLVRWSEELFRIFQLDPAGVAPTFAEHSALYVTEDLHLLRRAVERCVTKGKPYELELRAIRGDGQIRHCVARGRAEIDSHGRIQRLVGSLQDITERKQAEEALRREREQLEFVIEGSRLGTWVWNVQTDETVFNDIWAQMLGYTLDELGLCNYETWERLVHPDDLRMAKERLSRCITGEMPDYECEFRMKHKDGHWVWILDRGRVLTRDVEGKPLLMFGTHADITERRRREERIALLGQMLDAAPASITIHNTEGRFLYANSVTATLHGYRDEAEFLSLNLHDLDVPESSALLEERLRRIIEEGEARFEVAHYRKDGSSFPLEVLAKYTEWDGQPAVLSIASDITERKRAEEELRRRENQLQKIFEILPIGLWFADKDGTLLRGNPMGVKIWGAEPHAKISEYGLFKAWRLPSREPIEPDDWALAKTITKGATIVDELLEIEAFDGKKKTILNYSAPVLDDDGNVDGAIVVNLDVSDRKALEDQLRQAQKMESVGRLAGGVAHDFNNMLGVILGHTELAMDSVAPDDPLHHDLQEIHNAATRSADITRQLLAFARKQTIAPKVIDLNEKIERMLKMLQRLIGEDIDLAWLPQSSMWPVRMDPSQLDQILANLCVNARDAIEGVGKITIETGMATLDEAYCSNHIGFVPGDFVLMAVSDNGCGMDQEIKDKLFEPFFSTKGVGKGTGLGLATVYGIVKQNRGFINVYSEPGKGTTFRIYLPAQKAFKDQAQPEMVGGIPGGLENQTILLVEDEPAILSMTTTMLKRLGYTVLKADRPGKAVALAREHAGEIHLLMTDVVMPEMNGRDLAQSLLSLYPNMKRLFMSGYTANVIAHHGVLDEGVHFIQKPFSKKDLALKVSQALD